MADDFTSKIKKKKKKKSQKRKSKKGNKNLSKAIERKQSEWATWRVPHRKTLVSR